jgi:hypothetical protein
MGQVKDGQGGIAYQAVFTCDQCGWMQIGVGEMWSPPGNMTTEYYFDNVLALAWIPAAGIGPAFDDVPPPIASAATEAHRCSSIQAYRGATALARAVIEASAKAKGITKGALYDKIEALEKAGHVRPHIREAAHEVRHLGNDVAHGDFVEAVSREQAEEILLLMGEVLNEVFQSPARVTRVREAREAKVPPAES